MNLSILTLVQEVPPLWVPPGDLPVYASKRLKLDELVEDEEKSYKFSYYRPQELANTIEELLLGDII